MSIDRDTFERASEDELADVSVPERVLGYLLANRDRAFKARDLVEHKAAYWAVTDDEPRLRAYSGYERATALFNDRLGEEDEAAWRAHAPNDSYPGTEKTE